MSASPDFSGVVTEGPGVPASAEQLSMLVTRYRLAAAHAADRDVLEIACGPGVGLEYLSRRARRACGGDIDDANCRQARRLCGGRAGVLRLDAQRLPFADGSFDLVCCFEAIYYLDAPERLAAECRRVLRPGGLCILGSVNREWPGFNASPFSTRYLAASELAALFAAAGFQVELRAAFPDPQDTLRRRTLRLLRRGAIRCRLIPSSLRAKALLKRLVMGRLTPIPERLEDDLAPSAPLAMIAAGEPQRLHKMLYCLARLPEAGGQEGSAPRGERP